MQDADLDEAEALTGLARSLARSRPDMAETAAAVTTLVADAVRRPTPIDAELGFEAAGRRLRAGWLKSVAAETASVLRSPTDSEVERLERSRHDAYGYERDFQPESLERRCDGFFGPPPAGWTAAHLLFSSGQAALSTLLLRLAEGRPGKLAVAHVGAYFETRELAGRACLPVEDPAAADLLIVEPVACDGRFATHDAAALARRLRSGQALLLDETLTAPRTRGPEILEQIRSDDAPVVRLVSGLKLLQQGLELANVGILSLFARNADRARALADGLKRCRTLTGAGLRFVDALALEAPFFLDAAATRAYADRVVAHNAALARAVMAHNRRFKPFGEAGTWAAAPYCAFELQSGNSAEALAALAARIEAESEARGLLFQRGGSFGFRGHRFEVIEPETGAPPFLRIALGARDDRSRRGVTKLMAELASEDPRAASAASP